MMHGHHGFVGVTMSAPLSFAVAASRMLADQLQKGEGLVHRFAGVVNRAVQALPRGVFSRSREADAGTDAHGAGESAADKFLPLHNVSTADMDAFAKLLHEAKTLDWRVAAIWLLDNLHLSALANPGLVSEIAGKTVDGLMPGATRIDKKPWKTLLNAAMTLMPEAWEIECCYLRPRLPHAGIHPFLQMLRNALFRPVTFHLADWNERDLQCANRMWMLNYLRVYEEHGVRSLEAMPESYDGRSAWEAKIATFREVIAWCEDPAACHAISHLDKAWVPNAVDSFIGVAGDEDPQQCKPEDTRLAALSDEHGRALNFLNKRVSVNDPVWQRAIAGALADAGNAFHLADAKACIRRFYDQIEDDPNVQWRSPAMETPPLGYNDWLDWRACARLSDGDDERLPELLSRMGKAVRDVSPGVQPVSNEGGTLLRGLALLVGGDAARHAGLAVRDAMQWQASVGARAAVPASIVLDRHFDYRPLGLFKGVRHVLTGGVRDQALPAGEADASGGKVAHGFVFKHRWHASQFLADQKARRAASASADAARKNDAWPTEVALSQLASAVANVVSMRAFDPLVDLPFNER